MIAPTRDKVDGAELAASTREGEQRIGGCVQTMNSQGRQVGCMLCEQPQPRSKVAEGHHHTQVEMAQATARAAEQLELTECHPAIDPCVAHVEAVQSWEGIGEEEDRRGRPTPPLLAGNALAGALLADAQCGEARQLELEQHAHDCGADAGEVEERE